MSTPPRAKRVEHVREHHGDTRRRPLRVAARQGRPGGARPPRGRERLHRGRTAHLEPLRSAIFEEIRTRTQETDLSVPRGHGGWWYYSRTVEGSSTPPTAGSRVGRRQGRPMPEPGGDARGRAGAAGRQRRGRGPGVLLARRRSTSTPTAACSPTRSDVEGDERFTLRIKDMRSGERSSTTPCPTSATASAWSLRRRATSSTPGRRLVAAVPGLAARGRHARRRRRLVFEEPDERFWVGVGRPATQPAILDRQRLQAHQRGPRCSTPPTRPASPSWWPRAARASSTTSSTRVDRLLIMHNADAANFDARPGAAGRPERRPSTLFVPTRPAERSRRRRVRRPRRRVAAGGTRSPPLRVHAARLRPGGVRTTPDDADLRRAALHRRPPAQPRVARDRAAGRLHVAGHAVDGLRLRRRHRRAARCSSSSPCSAATTRRRTRSTGSGRPPPTARGCRSRWSTGADVRAGRHRAGAALRLRLVRDSHATRGFCDRPAVAARPRRASSRSPTCAAAVSWAGAGTTTARC